MSYVYSSYIIEDAFKMRSIYFKDYIEKLREITNDNIVAVDNDCIQFAKENIKIAVDRVKLFRRYTIAAERKILLMDRLDRLYFPVFYMNDKNHQLLEKNIWEYLRDNGVEDKERLELISYLLIEHINYDLNEFYSLSDMNLTSFQKISLISGIYRFLDVINYKKENSKNARKIYSTINDVEHLRHSSICDYFVTEDINLRLRRQFIFKALGINTEILSLSEFKRVVGDTFKNMNNA